MDFFVLESFTICSTCRQRKSRKKSSSTCNIVASLKQTHREQAFFFLGALNCDDEPGNILIGWKCHLGWMLLGSNTITFKWLGWKSLSTTICWHISFATSSRPYWNHTFHYQCIEMYVEYILKHGYQAIQWRNVCAITCLDVRVVKEELQL